MSKQGVLSVTVLLAAGSVASMGCSDDPVDTAGTSGGAATGGSAGTSTQASGGAASGSSGSGGSSMTTMTGGAPASGGLSSTGGSTANGGMPNTGGSTAGSGAAVSAGGSSAGSSAVAGGGAGGASTAGAPGAAGTPNPAGGQAGSAGGVQALAGAPGAGSGSGGQAAVGDTWESYAMGFFETYCVSCHNDDNQGVATRNHHELAAVVAEKDAIACGVAKSQADWMARGCTSGMPASKQFPAGSGAKPTDEERDRLLAWIDAGTP